MSDFVHGKDADRERLKTALMRGGQYIVKLQKPYLGDRFTKLADAEICDVGFPVFGTIPARYYKGIFANGDNMVLEVVTDED